MIFLGVFVTCFPFLISAFLVYRGSVSRGTEKKSRYLDPPVSRVVYARLPGVRALSSRHWDRGVSVCVRVCVCVCIKHVETGFVLRLLALGR